MTTRPCRKRPLRPVPGSGRDVGFPPALMASGRRGRWRRCFRAGRAAADTPGEGSAALGELAGWWTASGRTTAAPIDEGDGLISGLTAAGREVRRGSWCGFCGFTCRHAKGGAQR
ncbi:hypothetical protein TNIN_500381 [Trichonephila inaurata madagascariensis]|uniref:Uncharacterized protein n=1 Tax=Trichonephila inaurata madagascariensis TaxID=2747483 RepID=A0A8X7C2G5_9ARAC|nr:hypothetical protein TNIN_500381 [Trichonephila inaurata madagascariensis]